MRIKYNKPLIYRLERDYIFDGQKYIKEDLNCSFPYMEINGKIITIKKGYAWDGCSYKLTIFGIFMLGTPDGVIKYNVPITYYASLMHDALIQYRGKHGISRETTNLIFYDLLKDNSFHLAALYYHVVRMLAPKDGWN